MSGLSRLAGAFLAFAVVAAAGERTALTEEQRGAVVKLVGEELWGAMPAWRQRMVLDRYARYLAQPDRKREAVERVGLREWLLQHSVEEKVPRPLAEAAQRFPRELRPGAEKFAAARLRQLRLDRSLLRLPFPERRPMFLRLFPEPFDQETARTAFEELRKREAKSFAHALKEEVLRRDGSEDERRRIVREALRAEEDRLLQRVLGELDRLRGAHPERARAFFDLFSAPENLRFVTPRQRELIRYAMRPEECPLVDPEFLGPPPADPRERRLFESDFRVLARLDLLAEAGFSREMVLHLSGAGSPEDFLRAAFALRRPGPPGPPR